MLRYRILALVIILSPASAFAQSCAAEEGGPWAGKASLGYLSTSGNTDTTSYNTAFEVRYTCNKWSHTANGAANGASESEMTTAEAYEAGWKSEYSFTQHDYLFGRINWRKDRFSGVDEQLSESIGYGRKIIDTPVHFLSADVGVGHRSSDRRDGTSESSVIITGGADYKWTFSETSNFEQTIDVESGSDNTYIESVSALRAKLLGDFALVLSYTIKHNTDVPVGSQNTDRLSAVSLEYVF